MFVSKTSFSQVHSEAGLFSGLKKRAASSYRTCSIWPQRFLRRAAFPSSAGPPRRAASGPLQRGRKRRGFYIWRSLQVLFFLLLGYAAASIWNLGMTATRVSSIQKIGSDFLNGNNTAAAFAGQAASDKEGQFSGQVRPQPLLKTPDQIAALAIVGEAHQPASRKMIKPEKLDFKLYNGNGTVYKVPETWSRLHCPWFVPTATFKLKSVAEASNQILYSPFRHHLSDGIGHSMAIINFEIRLANRLGFAYSHRVANYSSLTETDSSAVEDFFGWGQGAAMQRKDLQQNACLPVGDPVWASQRWSGRFDCNTCASLKDNNKYGLQTVIELPAHVAYKCVKKTETKVSCDADVADSTIEEYLGEVGIVPSTLFQIPTAICKFPVSDGQFGLTKTYFWGKYWDRHRFPNPKRPSLDHPTTRHLKLSESALNIAVHVRRGDFLNPEVGKVRDVISDKTYAELLCRMIQTVLDEGGPFSEVPIHVHIYSEGRLLNLKPKSVHGIEDQDRTYYDSEGTPRAESWWKELILNTAKEQLDAPPFGQTSLQWPGKYAMNTAMKRLHVRLHISEPTLSSMHDMVSADRKFFLLSPAAASSYTVDTPSHKIQGNILTDYFLHRFLVYCACLLAVFLGSKSGMSMNAVWALARGVSLLPKGSPVGTEFMYHLGHSERVCCTVAYNATEASFRDDIFRKYWKGYALANGDSTEYAIRHKKFHASVH